MTKQINTQKSRHLSLGKDDYCPKCGTKMATIIEILGKKRKVPCLCECRKKEYERQLELDKQKERQLQLEKLRKYSLMDDAFFDCNFKNFKVDKYNKDIYKIGINYCKNWKDMKAQNVGMTFMGPPGIGKTFLTFCIANKLLEQFVPVIAISSINIINRIYESYGKFGEEGEVTIINQLKNADLLILDDLGAEHEGRKGKEKQIIYSIIDSRIRAKKPMIVTTNLNKQQLRNKLTGTDGIDRSYDRLLEVCPIIEIEGKSRRMESGDKKFDILTELLK